jgi:hypothetical protein
MNYTELSTLLMATGTDREWLLMPAGINGLWHLGEQDVRGLHLIDALPYQVIDFVRNTL